MLEEIKYRYMCRKHEDDGDVVLSHCHNDQ